MTVSSAPMKRRVAVFPGTFDPVSNGHLDVIRRGAALFDRLVVAVARSGRDTWFSADERVTLLKDAAREIEGADVVAFDGLLAEFARSAGAAAILRGVRTFQDWEYELRMASMNRHLAPEVETLFLAPSASSAFISSSLVREVASMGGDLTGLVPAAVLDAVRAKAKARRSR